MPCYYWPCLIWCLISVSPAFAQKWASEMFPLKSHDYGVLAAGTIDFHDFEFTNLYKEDIHVHSIRPGIRYGKTVATRDTLKSWEKGTVETSLFTGSGNGLRAGTITVTFDKPFSAEVVLHFQAFIRSDLTINPGCIDFDNVDAVKGAEKTLEIRHRGRTADWRIEDIKAMNPHLEATLSIPRREDSLTIYVATIRIKPNAHAGKWKEHLQIITSDAERNTVSVPIKANVTREASRSFSSILIKPTEK